MSEMGQNEPGHSVRQNGRSTSVIGPASRRSALPSQAMRPSARSRSPLPASKNLHSARDSCRSKRVNFHLSSMPEASGRARSGVFSPPTHRSRWALATHGVPALDEELPFGPRAQEVWRPKVPISNRLVSAPRSRQLVTILYRLSAIPRWYVEGMMLSTEVRRLASQ
jgi:hypothetical protein